MQKGNVIKTLLWCDNREFWSKCTKRDAHLINSQHRASQNPLLKGLYKLYEPIIIDSLSFNLCKVQSFHHTCNFPIIFMHDFPQWPILISSKQVIRNLVILSTCYLQMNGNVCWTFNTKIFAYLLDEVLTLSWILIIFYTRNIFALAELVCSIIIVKSHHCQPPTK